MSELTLPGDIPGLLRLCSPVRTVPHGATGSQTFPSVVIPSLAPLYEREPDGCLPDGSRWVDAEALRLVCLHVAGRAP